MGAAKFPGLFGDRSAAFDQGNCLSLEIGVVSTPALIRIAFHSSTFYPLKALSSKSKSVYNGGEARQRN
jgi:hypothetical protein